MKSVLIGCLVTVATFAGQPVAAQQVEGGAQMQVGRYTTHAAASAEEVSQPLDVNIHITFPRSTVSTVGEAIHHTLLRTGFRLVELGSLGASEQEFLNLPLPESQRVLGIYQVHQVLRILLGQVWQLQVDEVRRLVSFSLKPGLQPTPPAPAPSDAAAK